MRALYVLMLAAMALPGAAGAATRSFTVTGYERIRVAGPFTVRLRTGPGPSARAEGDARALDRVQVDVQGDLLMISANRSDAGWATANLGGVVIDVTTPRLTAALIVGSGRLSVDKARALRFQLTITGAGRAAIGAIETDDLRISVNGPGEAVVGGQAAQTRVVLQGPGLIDGAKLKTADLAVTSNGSGTVNFIATRSARVTATGSGDVTVEGSPACTVKAVGSGQVRCGAGD